MSINPDLPNQEKREKTVDEVLEGLIRNDYGNELQLFWYGWRWLFLGEMRQDALEEALKKMATDGNPKTFTETYGEGGPSQYKLENQKLEDAGPELKKKIRLLDRQANHLREGIKKYVEAKNANRQSEIDRAELGRRYNALADALGEPVATRWRIKS